MMKIRKSKLFILAAATIALTSCNDAEDIKMPNVGDNAISFKTYMGRNTSRASSLTTETLTNFGVFGYLNDGNAYASAGTPDFMYNQKVEKLSGAWSYTPLKYWPSNPNKKASFFAYAPYVANPSAAVGNSSAVTSITANDYVGDPTLTFEVGNDVSKQVDLVYASAVDKTNADGVVEFAFAHALTRIGFKVVGWEPGSGESYDDNTTVTINAVKLATVRKTATLNVKTGVWSNAVDDSDYHAYTLSTRNGLLQNNVITAGDTDTKQLNLDGDYMMILPDLSSGTDKDKFILFVDYTVETVDPSLEGGKVTVRNNVYRYLSPGFEAGRSYNIIIHLGMNGGNIPDDGDDDGPTPVDPDPDPENPVDPTPPGNGSYIGFTATMTGWSSPSTEMDVPLIQ